MIDFQKGTSLRKTLRLVVVLTADSGGSRLSEKGMKDTMISMKGRILFI